MALERYREIVPDWSDFLDAVERPEPTTFRVRRGRIDPERLAERLREKGFELETVGGTDGFYRVLGAPYPVSKTLEHWLGLFYIQQAATGLAAPALDPRPGERVLDLCAAPGGKTAHLAERMDDRGTLVAADVDDRRLRALLGNLYRTGYPNVLVVQADGRTFPGGPAFDRVLVDAPCSAEGNVRDRGGEIPERDPSFTEYVTGLQEALLRRAVEVARPGGSVLYVTCTFAPEENEAVVDRVLRDAPVTVEPLALQVPHAPGLVRFGDERFDPRLRGAVRIYPHHLDSGGLFLARLRRTDGSAGEAAGSDPAAVGAAGDGVPTGAGRADGWHPVPSVFPDEKEERESDDRDRRERAEDRIERAREGLHHRFGVPEGALAAGGWIVRGKSVWMHRCDAWPVPSWDGSADWRVLSLGLRALKRDPRTPAGERPTSDLLRRLDGLVERNVVTLERSELFRLLDREPRERPDLDDGFVAFRHEGRILGRGWVHRGTLRNEISKTRSKRLASFLESGTQAAASARAGPGEG